MPYDADVDLLYEGLHEQRIRITNVAECKYYCYIGDMVPIAILEHVGDRWIIQVARSPTGTWCNMSAYGILSTRHVIMRLLAVIEDPLV